MTLLNISLTRKLSLFLVAAMLSVPAMASDFNQAHRLANQGLAEDQSNLGLMYYNGEGVRQDYAEVIKWYEKAANQGDAGAKYNLGVVYEYGKGVHQDFTRAAEWYEKAANQGHIEAQYNLGVMYEYGQGVNQDNEKAKESFGKACDNGEQKGCDRYRDLNQ